MDFFDIINNYPIPVSQKGFFDHAINYFKSIIKQATPKEIYDLGPNPTAEDLQKAYELFEASSPFIYRCEPTLAPCSMGVTFIVQAEYTWGLGRFASDMINRWLIPGKQVPLYVSQGMNFAFRRYAHFNFYCHNIIITVSDQQEIDIINENFPKLAEEMHLVIKATIHARRMTTTAALPMEQQRIFIRDYLTTLINSMNKDFDRNVYHQVHQVFVYAAAEHNIARIKSNFARLAYRAPHMFDRDIYFEIQHFVLLFRNQFMACRTQFHLYRIISYMYIFRKWILEQLSQNPNARYTPVKFMPAKIEGETTSHSVLGIIIGVNMLLENEIFEARHIIASIRVHLPEIQEVKNSYVVDQRRNIEVSTHYIEIEKQDGSSFTLNEMKLLKEKLAKELPSRIERRTHPLFVHRNEEEVMRNILILSRQLKYVRDTPQVMVNYAKQTTSSLCFTVILLRLLKPGSKPLLKDLDALKFIEHDVKIVGHLRRKYPKEANVFEIRVDKHPFLRHDYSLDLYKAREKVINQLVEIVGEVRDFNGGMISKQTESLTQLKSLLKNQDIIDDFLLENFFYSINPSYMQSIIDPKHLETLFMMLLGLTKGDFDSVPYHFQSQMKDGICYIAIGAPQSSFQKFVSAKIEALQILGSDLCGGTVNIYDISTLYYLYIVDDARIAANLIATVKKALSKWAKQLNTIQHPNDEIPLLI